MTSERSKRRDFLSLIFISKSISKKLLIKILFFITIFRLAIPAFFRFTDVTVTSVNLKKTGMASRNIVIKNNTRCFKSALL